MDNTPQDLSDTGDISRKILFKSVNNKPKQIEKASAELETRGLVQLHAARHNTAQGVHETRAGNLDSKTNTTKCHIS